MSSNHALLSKISASISERNAEIESTKEEMKPAYRSPLTYMLVSFMFWFPNALLFLPYTRSKLFFWIAAYDFIMMFVLSSMVGQLKFG
jgi:hypothetical protein